MFFYLRNVRKAGMQAALDADTDTERDEPIGRIGMPQEPKSYADLLMLDPEDVARGPMPKELKDDKPLLLWDDA